MHHTIVSNKPENPNYSYGMIDEIFIKKQVKDFLDRKIFIFGPPGMVKAMEELCNKLGYNKEKIVKENFIGY